MKKTITDIAIVKEGWCIILVPFLLCLIAYALGHGIIGLILFGFTVFSVYFFRNPIRVTPTENNFLISPADGTIIAIKDNEKTRYTEGTFKRISIFMSVVNVHVNRIPLAGKVAAIIYNKGKFLVASKDKASMDNEQNAVVIDNPSWGRYCMVQIAGLVARRIVCYAEVGDEVTAGTRFGLIKFGSRVDLFVPSNIEMMSHIGKKVHAGETILGRFK